VQLVIVVIMHRARDFSGCSNANLLPENNTGPRTQPGQIYLIALNVFTIRGRDEELQVVICSFQTFYERPCNRVRTRR
jgi:hypothetical protein